MYNACHVTYEKDQKLKTERKNYTYNNLSSMYINREIEKWIIENMAGWIWTYESKVKPKERRMNKV